MPVRRFRSVEEMQDVWYEPGSPELMAAVWAAWDLAHRTLQPRFPPGVYKHRSIEEAQELSDAWDRANFERYQARRKARS